MKLLRSKRTAYKDHLTSPTKAVRNKAQKWVFEALVELRGTFPFPIRGLDSDNGSEFINAHLLAYCEQEELTFTRSRSGNKNDGAYVEQKNWSVVRRAVGYHRYDTPAELELLNSIYALLRLQTNFFCPQQKLVEKHRHGAKATKRYDTAKTPYRRVLADKRVPKQIKDWTFAAGTSSSTLPRSGETSPPCRTSS